MNRKGEFIPRRNDTWAIRKNQKKRGSENDSKVKLKGESKKPGKGKEGNSKPRQSPPAEVRGVAVKKKNQASGSQKTKKKRRRMLNRKRGKRRKKKRPGARTEEPKIAWGEKRTPEEKRTHMVAKTRKGGERDVT